MTAWNAWREEYVVSILDETWLSDGEGKSTIGLRNLAGDLVAFGWVQKVRDLWFGDVWSSVYAAEIDSAVCEGCARKTQRAARVAVEVALLKIQDYLD